MTCLHIGSAIGALGNPPPIRHRGYAVTSTAAAAIAAGRTVHRRTAAGR